MDEWMYERELLPPPVLEQNEEWYNCTVSDLPLKKVFRNYINSYAIAFVGKNLIVFTETTHQCEQIMSNPESIRVDHF